MKKTVLITICLAGMLFSQAPLEKKSAMLEQALVNKTANERVLIWVTFKDKGSGLNKSNTSAPSLLSEKAIERRKKVLPENKVIDETDFPVNREYISRVEHLGSAVNQISRWFNSVSVWTTKDKLDAIAGLDCVSQIDIVQKLAKSKFTEEVQAVPLEKVQSQSGNAASPYSLNYGPSLKQLSMLHVPELHDQGYNGKGVVIAVLDAGFNNLPHEAFSSMNIIATYDFVNHRVSVADGNGGLGSGTHGTATLSVIGGYKPGQLIGPSYGASFILAKTENTESETPIEEDNWIAGMEWADSIGVDITSTSLGYLTFDSPYTSYTWQNMDGRTCKMTLGAELAARKGIFVVNSAGNEGLNSSHNTLDAPADADSILTVGAVDTLGARAYFSSVGNTIDGRTKPDVVAPGYPVYAAGPSSTNYYYYTSGTSFSCPLSAGVAGILLQAKPTLTPFQLLNLLRSTAGNFLAPNRELGWGLVNALKAFQNITSSVDDVITPSTFTLYQNYPNPFNPTTEIKYSLNESADINLSVYTIDGRCVSTLFSGRQSSGEHRATFESSAFASGVYIYRLSVMGVNGKVIQSDSRKMIHLK